MTDPIPLALTLARKHYAATPSATLLSRYNTNVLRLRFEDGGARVVKIAKSSDSGPLRKEAAIIERLAHEGVPVPAVEHLGLDADPPYLIMRSAGEENVADALSRSAAVGLGLVREMGAVLARVHTTPWTASGDIRDETILPHRPEASADALRGMADALAGAGHLTGEETQWFRSLTFPEIDGRSICHGDFHPVHGVVAEGRLTAVVDWEGAWAGHPLIDVAIGHAYADYYGVPGLTEAFLAGYAGVRPLPANYTASYLPVRAAHAVGLMQVFALRRRPDHVARAAGLYRRYAAEARDRR